MKKKKAWVWVLAVTAALIGLAAILGVGAPPEKSFDFVTEDHPIDMWQDGKDRWAYFSVGTGTSAELAQKARAELSQRGFQEVATQKPWFRFRKGNEEVVICNHSEFAVNSYPGGAKLDLHAPTYSGKWPCVLVKNGPGTSGSLVGFQINKLIHRW